MKELVLTLMLWIGGQTGFPIPDPPTVEIKTTRELNNVLYDCENLINQDKALYDSVCISDTEDVESNKVTNVLALYNNETKEIYLPSYFDMNNLAHRAILLHELVHHLQYNAGYNKKVRCPGLLEKQAYDLMDVWLAENNTKMPEELEIGPLLRFTVTSCSGFFMPFVPEIEEEDTKDSGK